MLNECLKSKLISSNTYVKISFILFVPATWKKYKYSVNWINCTISENDAQNGDLSNLHINTHYCKHKYVKGSRTMDNYNLLCCQVVKAEERTKYLLNTNYVSNCKQGYKD